jgi:hypothetical protein
MSESQADAKVLVEKRRNQVPKSSALESFFINIKPPSRFILQAKKARMQQNHDKTIQPSWKGPRSRKTERKQAMVCNNR